MAYSSPTEPGRSDAGRRDVTAAPRPPLLRAVRVAELLDISVKSVYRLAETGRLPSVRLSQKCVRFEPAEVEEFIESAKRKESRCMN